MPKRLNPFAFYNIFDCDASSYVKSLRTDPIPEMMETKRIQIDRWFTNKFKIANLFQHVPGMSIFV